MRVTRENLNACKAFVDFWEDHVIIPSVRVFYRHPSLQKKPLMVMCLMSDDFNVFKIHMMMVLVNMARKFGIYGRTSEQPFCTQKSASSVKISYVVTDDRS